MKKGFCRSLAAAALAVLMMTAACGALGEGYTRGDEADEIASIQEALTELDLYYADVTGRYGERTEEAVKRFQKKYKLPQTGVADKETLRWLYEESGVEIPEDSILNGYVIGSAGDSTLTSGEQSSDVRALQEALAALGYYDGAITGHYGNLTKEAVRQFQKKNGLSADGVAGPRTLEKLSSLGKGSAGTSSAASSTGSASSSSGAGGVLKHGDVSSAVRTLQENLTALGYYDGEITGRYGSLTKEAVRQFQKKNALSADGVYGKKTQERLESALTGKKESADQTGSGTKEESEETAQTAAATLLRKGDESAAVRALQENLDALDYYDGEITGRYGDLTKEAVRQFQRKNGLSADGIAGMKTLAAIEKAITDAEKKAEEEKAAEQKKQEEAKKAEEYANSLAGRASKVLNTNFSAWRKNYANGQTCTVYDFVTGRSWKLRILSKDKHMDAEPLTAEDTASMNKAFEGMKAWTPKAVWVTFSDGKTYIGSTHNVPHGTQNLKDNNFEGHICVHFPMPMEDAEAIGPNATNFQKVVVSGWEATQGIAKQ